MGNILGIDGDAYGRYERNEVRPSIEMAAKIALALETALDYLVGNIDMKVDTSTLKRVVDIQLLSSEDKGHLFFLLDAFLRDAKARQAYLQ